MIPARFNPKPAFKALDNHSPFHDSQVGGHKRKPVAKSKATKAVEKARGRRKKVRRTIISVSQENYLENNYMLTQPVHYCGPSASHGIMEQENSTAASPIDLVGLSDDDNGNGDERCSGFRTASSILTGQSDSDKLETESNAHRRQSRHRHQVDGVELMTSTSRPRDTTTTSTQSRSASDHHRHTTTTTTRKITRKSTTRINRRHKDLPSVRFGTILAKAAKEHQHVQCSLSMVHHIRHSAKSSLLVCLCSQHFFFECATNILL